MSNHFHLLIERQAEPVGRIMQRVLTGYSQYHNRKYRKVGHVFQGRHKAILCEADRYLAELVRYIHLNPVRAKMVRKAERYPWSSQRAYLGIEKSELVDVDSVLRLFGARKQKASEHFAEFVAAGSRLGHQDGFYSLSNGHILGSEEFVDESIHHVWERDQKAPRAAKVRRREFDAERLLKSVEEVFGISTRDFTGQTKQAAAVVAKEAVILAGRELGASFRRLSEIVALDDSTVSRRYDKARAKMKDDDQIGASVNKILNVYDRS